MKQKMLIPICLAMISLMLVSCGSKEKALSEATTTPSIIAGTPVTATPLPTPTPVPSPTPEPYTKVKALYLTGWTAGDQKSRQKFVDIAKSTEVNAYVVDIKDSDGYVSYESKVPEVQAMKSFQKKYDAEAMLKQFHNDGIRVIGRLVCFKDTVVAEKHPDWAIQKTGGGVWKDSHNLAWLNAYNQSAWKYNVDIAKEALAMGFDEIQFDYVRFPNDGPVKEMNFAAANGKKKTEAINEFLAYAHKEMPNAHVSADVFGIIVESPSDGELIGQNLEQVGKDVESICPMVYPSHYALGQEVNGVKFPKPDLDPYGVVNQTLVKAKNRLSKVEGTAGKVKMRAWLQDFEASWLGKGNWQTYGDEQVRQQIKAVYDAGYDEWILWDPNNSYRIAAFDKKK